MEDFSVSDRCKIIIQKNYSETLSKRNSRPDFGTSSFWIFLPKINVTFMGGDNVVEWLGCWT